MTSHAGAMSAVIIAFRAHWPDLDLAAVGHHDVHGGANRTEPAPVTEPLLAQL